MLLRFRHAYLSALMFIHICGLAPTTQLEKSKAERVTLPFLNLIFLPGLPGGHVSTAGPFPI